MLLFYFTRNLRNNHRLFCTGFLYYKREMLLLQLVQTIPGVLARLWNEEQPLSRSLHKFVKTFNIKESFPFLRFIHERRIKNRFWFKGSRGSIGIQQNCAFISNQQLLYCANELLFGRKNFF